MGKTQKSSYMVYFGRQISRAQVSSAGIIQRIGKGKAVGTKKLGKMGDGLVIARALMESLVYNLSKA
jgi:hypothetical protein